MVKLIKPQAKYFNEYKEMMDEWNMEGSRIAPWLLHFKYHTEEYFQEMLDRQDEVEKGENLGDYASSSTYWLYDEERNKLLGASNLRHYLTDEGLKTWGHIGYGIRPSERKRGYATELLKLTLEEAKKRDIKRVLLGAYTGNIGSWKTMEKCGAELENIVIEEETGLHIKRYWISLKKRFATGEHGRIKEKEYKIINVDDEYFKGDICLVNIKKAEELVCKGEEYEVTLIKDNYKILEFYDYHSKVCLTAFYNDNNEIVEWYFDIARKIGKENGIPYEDDLYLDVVFLPNGKIYLLDEDELKDAFDRKEMTKQELDEAYKIANDLMKRLEEKQDEVRKFTDKYLKIIEKGEKNEYI